MTHPAEPETSSARAWAGSTLVVLGAVWLVVGLLALEVQTREELALVVAPAVVLVVAGALVSRGAGA